MTCQRRHWKLVLPLLCVALLAAWTPAGAQTTSASVQGTVVDSSRSVMPGVTVTLTSKSQGDVLTAVTDPEGRFVFPIVRPDTYMLKATLEGFKTLEQSTVVVNANDKLSAGTLVLEVGSLQENVTVLARSTELQTNSGERSFTLENQALTNIANNGRAMFNFATLVPGVVSQNAGNGEIGSVGDFTVNGQRPNSNNITIDGVANIDTGNNGGNMATTNVDSVAEFKILTNAYQAEYGRATGGQVQVVTKSGTQDFHGSGYWYGRRSDWNATSWINNRDNLATPKASRDDRGYTIGGPIFIPNSFNADKRKLFFFWSQEWQTRKDPAGERRATVPTALERRGDFSQSVDSSGKPFPYIRDYQTGLPCGPADTRGCFQDGGVLGRIPANRLYQPGLNALGIFPDANAVLPSGQTFTSQVPDQAPRREDLLRVDYQLTDKWRVTGRYMNTKEEITQAYGTTWAGNGSDQLPMPTLFLHPGKNWMVSGLGVLNSTTSLELQVGSASNSLNYQLQQENLFRDAAGLGGLPLLFPDAVQADYIPWFQFRGGRTGNAGQYQTDRGPFTNENRTVDVIANLTKVMGAHTGKVGFYYQHSYKPQSIFASFNSLVEFVNDDNNPFDTGYSYANAATGVFRNYTQASKYALPEWNYNNIEWYAQDNWKVKRLTLDYGIRFYYLTPQWDTTLQAANFLPDKYDPSLAAKLYTPVCLTSYPCSGGDLRGMDPTLIAGGVAPSPGNTVDGRFIGRLVQGTSDASRFNGAFQAGQGINDQLQDGNAFEVSPRLGAVYDISGVGSTIVRGGWGIFYDRPQGNMVFDMISNAPSVLTSTLQWGRLQSLTAAGGDPLPTLSLNPTAFNFKPPRVQSWNVGVQQKLMYQMVFDIAYVGSKSDDQLRQQQINALPRGTTFQASAQDPTRAPSATPGASALQTDLLRPYQGYGNIRMWDYSGYSNYNALQTSITRRYDKGYMFSAFYVWSKALTINNDDFTAGLPNVSKDEVRRVDYSYANFDRPHNFVMNGIYQVPKFGSGATGYLLSDWQVSGVYRWTSGRPYTADFSIPGISSTNLTGTDNPNARIALTCDPGKGYSSDPYRQFNTSCFAPPQPGSDGAESARYIFDLPPINNVDASLSKRFELPRRVKAEIRLDAFNLLNHTQFTDVNKKAEFKSLSDSTITNLPYDASGKLVNKSGFGTVSAVANPRILQLVLRMTF